MLGQKNFAVGTLAKLGKRIELVIMGLQIEALPLQDLQVPPLLHRLLKEIDQTLLSG